ncbi:MAG: glycine cleavage system protein GcvH [Proteobacteria bacterium]|nr:glycine cleavage system protein GcvH [Pseudomonadota bacterium]
MGDNFTEVTYDKFIFKVDKGCLYHANECWARQEGDMAVVGITDFLQKTAGDVAFVELPETGANLSQGGEAGVMETIKTTVTLISPLSGEVLEINSSLEEEPQLLNTDPFGAGWLFKLKLNKWEEEKGQLIDAETYLPLMKKKIEQELSKK